MKNTLLIAGLFAGILTLAFLPESRAQTNNPACGETCTCTGGHAPIGVMGDHMHQEGDWMFSYRFMFMKMDANRSGTDNLSQQEVYDLGYDRAARDMTMEMHMFSAMYAPDEDLTFMLMGNYIGKDMTMDSKPDGGMHHEGMGTMHGDEGHGMSDMDHERGSHEHSASGWGDTVVTALYRIWRTCCQSIHAGIGIGLPTADVEKHMNGMYQPYGMQLGNGVWDARPSITYNGGGGGFNWGGQLSGRINLEDENDAGFAFGNRFSATTWLTRDVAKGVNLSGRVLYDHQEKIEGHYNEPHSHDAPPYLQQNYGGDIVQAGFGVNVSTLSGWRIAVEALLPVYEDVNGVQLSRDYTIITGLKKSL